MVKKVLIGVGVLIVVLFTAVFISIKSAQGQPPPTITANFTDLSKIERISRYRSCAGHVTVPQNGSENKRNMKHYFWVKPEFNKAKTVEIYSPYDGFVADVRAEPNMNLEGEMWITPMQIFGLVPPLGVWSFSVQHIDIRPDLKLGDKVKAGELIGWLAVSQNRGDSFDIVYGKSGFPPKTIDNWTDPFADLDSVFTYMSDAVFAQYQQKGIATKADLIISKAKRDQNLCQYQDEGPYFSNQDESSNWTVLK
ncbi:MAG: hypothetical protein HY429_00960 [Candidatus Levybacteria bacterium]|nr:hypothetical protein [Candidatus Daviesbacteria bacterium]MBI4078848.1 hypothetical protein [Candidatus Levybacteria bacterium]